MNWSAYVDHFHEEKQVVHLARPDGSPACGARYYMMTGRYDFHENRKCRNCLRLKPAAAKAGTDTR